LEKSLEFWRDEFVRGGKDPEKEGYLYAVRHNYGTVGKRQSYTPYACAKIIEMKIKFSEELHGCPFRISDRNSLKTVLKEKELGESDIREVFQLLDEKSYTEACKRVFLATHPGHQGQHTQNHPNKYFDQSFFYNQKKLKTNEVAQNVLPKPNIKTTTVVVNVENQNPNTNDSMDIGL